MPVQAPPDGSLYVGLAETPPFRTVMSGVVSKSLVVMSRLSDVMSGLPTTSLAGPTLLQPTRLADRGESAKGDVAARTPGKH